jgi:hypothetical protein
MKRRTSGRVWMVALLLVVVSSAFGAADSPSGDPPFGLEFADGRSGQQYEGLVTLVFRDYTRNGDYPLTAARFDAVARLRKGNAYEVFYVEYDCADYGTPDPCQICGAAVPDRIYVEGQQTAVQLCLQDLIEPDVIAKFGLADVDVRLKDIGGFASDEDPVDAPVRAISAADIEVTVK